MTPLLQVSNTTDQQFPTRIVAIALLVMMLLTIASSVAWITVDRKARMLSASQLTVQTHAERLSQLGDGLQLAAKLAVAEGDPKYAEHHRRGKAELRRTIGELRTAIQLPENAAAVLRVASAEAEISVIEEEALALAAAGDPAAAKTLLYSPRYRALDDKYSAGIRQIQQRSSSYVRQLQSEVERFSWVGRIASLVGIPLILLACVFIIGPARRWGAALTQARSEAEDATHAKSDFLAAMSHEMRTPLNSIIGFTDLLLQDELTHEQRRQVRLVQQSGSALLVVINDLLDFSAIEAGKLKLEAEPFCLASLLDNATSMIGGSVDAKGLSLHTEISNGLHGFFLGDQDRLRQILLNLLNNAVKFTNTGSIRITVEAAQHSGGEAARFVVEDQGIGIAADRQDRLFQKFSQADSSIRRRYGGSGLGLAICKQLVEMMGGEIGFSSQENVGSRFWFTIPVSRCPAPAHPSTTKLASSNGIRSASILLVEDVPANRELACAMLASLGHNVETANDGALGVAAARRGAFDLILMDVQMPNMDGITATGLIRKLPGARGQIPVIALTANVLQTQKDAFTAAGMNGCVAKPIKIAELSEAIQGVVGCSTPPVNDEFAGHVVFENEVLQQLSALLPPGRIKAHLAGLGAEADWLSCASTTNEELGPRLHKLVSQAGSLGFMKLSLACSALEAALVANDEPCDASLKRAAAAAKAALPKITELMLAA